MRQRFLLSLVSALFCASTAHAELKIDITKGNVDPLPIALPDLAGSGTGADIMRVVAADLERSGLFKPIDQAAFIEEISVGILLFLLRQLADFLLFAATAE